MLKSPLTCTVPLPLPRFVVLREHYSARRKYKRRYGRSDAPRPRKLALCLGQYLSLGLSVTPSA